MNPDKPGRSLDQPHKKLDLVQAYKLRVVNRLSYAEIAHAMKCPKSTIHAALHRLNGLIPDPDQVAAFEGVEGTILTSAKIRLLASCLDENKLEKATLNQAAFAFTQISTQERLVRGKSTQNLLMASLIQKADEGLFKKPSEPV